MSTRSAGFTLIELLIVMVILALGAAAVGPRLWSALTPDPARDIPRQLQDRIDKLRSDAIFKRNGQAATIDIDSNTLLIGDAEHGWQLPDGWQFAIDENAPPPSPSGDGTAPDPNAPPRIKLGFAPDGTATEAHFLVTGPQAEQGWRFAVSPITGRLSIGPIATADDDTTTPR